MDEDAVVEPFLRQLGRHRLPEDERRQYGEHAQRYLRWLGQQPMGAVSSDPAAVGPYCAYLRSHGFSSEEVVRACRVIGSLRELGSRWALPHR